MRTRIFFVGVLLVVCSLALAVPLNSADDGFYVIPIVQSQSQLDARYVNQSGDDMNGRLSTSIISLGGAWTEALKGSLLGGTAVGAGVSGYSEGTTANGVYGGAIGASGVGVFGQATGSSGIGVKGQAPASGWAGYFDGRLYVNGNIRIPSNSSIINASGKDVFHTGWSSAFGDYTDIKSGYEWGSGEPVAVVAGANGMFVTKGDASGTPHAVTLMKVDTSGRLSCPVLEITGGADLSEQFNVHSQANAPSPAPGMVVSIDPEKPGDLVISHSPYDRKIAGIISGAGGVNPGMLMGQKGSQANGAIPVALSGRVYCWADASSGAIEPGDLLTTSDNPGHAMKVKDYGKAQGAVLGKAMSLLKSGKGLILVLVSLQ
jgi:hypothetical protein